MKTKKCSIELKNLHKLDDAMREFSRSARLDLEAPRIGTTANVLRNKLNPDQEFHKLSLLETVNLSANTGDMSLFHAALSMLGYDCHKVNDGRSAEQLISQVLHSASASGKVTALFDQANEDQHIDEDERNSLIKATEEAIQKLQSLRSSLFKKELA